jgi:hypothetical protein
MKLEASRTGIKRMPRYDIVNKPKENRRILNLNKQLKNYSEAHRKHQAIEKLKSIKLGGATSRKKDPRTTYSSRNKTWVRPSETVQSEPKMQSERKEKQQSIKS